MTQVALEDILAARNRIRGAVVQSPCQESIPLSELCRCRVYCKLEYLQPTGSFKERGARNALLLLSAEQRQRGVIAASAGNHALALAYHGGRLNVPVTVVMPRFAPLIKQSRCRRYGAHVILAGETFSEAKELAFRLAQEQHLEYIHGYDAPNIIAGQGTIGLEVLEQVPDLDAVVIPIGGAGLIAGIAVAIKSLRPQTEVIGVESEHTASFSAALTAGGPVPFAVRPSLADGLAVGQVGANAFALARDRVDRVVQVSEDAIALSIVRLLELEKSVVEGAGAASLAAFLAGALEHLAGKNVALILCGGNIDLAVLPRLIDLGLYNDGRLIRFSAVISDRPGGLARLAGILGDVGASIQEITHDRTFSGSDVTVVKVLCTVGTRDREHVEQIFQALSQQGIAFQRLDESRGGPTHTLHDQGAES